MTEATINRRQFIGRCTRAGLSVAAAGALGIGFYDGQPPAALSNATATVQIPDFSIAELSGKICIARGTDRTEAVRQAFDALGGMKAFVKPGERVLLKVNAAFASPPALGATSHPDLVAAVVRLCLDSGASRVIVTDNPINDPASCFALTGIEAAARLAGAEVVIPRESLFQHFSVSGGRLIRDWPILYAPLARVDRIIGMAPVKDHHRSGASMTLKNWYGLLGGRRNIFHQDIHTIIQELAMMIKPTVVVLDGTQSMMSNGPTGGSLSDLKPTGTLIVSTDPVAADAAVPRCWAAPPRSAFYRQSRKRRSRHSRLSVAIFERDTGFMRIITARRISQIFFFLLFLWFCIVSTLGEQWWQLRGWPVNWLIQLDPLVGLGTLLATGTIYAGLLWGLLTVVLTILLGRFFCGWLCPFGTLHQAVGWLANLGRRASWRIAANRYRRGQGVKYALLVFLLGAAAGDLTSRLLGVPIQSPYLAAAIVVVLFLLGVGALRLRTISGVRWVAGVAAVAIGWAILGLFTDGSRLLAASLQTGLLDPLPLFCRSVNLTLLPLVDGRLISISAASRLYPGTVAIGAIFWAAVLLNLVIPRFYCRFVCPLGALFGILGKNALWRVGQKADGCTACGDCDRYCEGGCEPSAVIRTPECVLCMNCLADCRHDVMGYHLHASAAGEVAVPDISKRELVAASGRRGDCRSSGTAGRHDRRSLEPGRHPPSGVPAGGSVSPALHQVRPVHAGLPDQRDPPGRPSGRY